MREGLYPVASDGSADRDAKRRAVDSIDRNAEVNNSNGGSQLYRPKSDMLWQDRVMSLQASQRRALNRIGKTLADDDLHLGQLFAFFTRLADREPMPATERVTALPWRRRRIRRMWPVLVTVIVLAAVTGTIVARAGRCPVGGCSWAPLPPSRRTCREPGPGSSLPASPGQPGRQ